MANINEPLARNQVLALSQAVEDVMCDMGKPVHRSSEKGDKFNNKQEIVFAPLSENSPRITIVVEKSDEQE
jgi:hypothetical protein